MRFVIAWLTIVGVLVASYFAYTKVETQRSNELDDKIAQYESDITLLTNKVKHMSKQAKEAHTTLSLAFPDRAEQIAKCLGLDTEEETEEDLTTDTQPTDSQPATQPVVTRPTKE